MYGILENIVKPFLLGVMVDILFVLWIYSSRSYRYYLGAISSMSISACTLFGFIGVYDNRYQAVPYLFGLGLGTVAGMLIQKKIEKK